MGRGTEPHPKGSRYVASHIIKASFPLESVVAVLLSISSLISSCLFRSTPHAFFLAGNASIEVENL